MKVRLNSGLCLGIALVIAVTLAVSACATRQQSLATQQAAIDLSLLETLPAEQISYPQQVRPILQRRCVVCHGCYDAPCQLKLSSPAGIQRGASKVKVYNGARFETMAPTRLYVDAKSTAQWRRKGFHSILNEGAATAEQNLAESVMYKMLRLKQINPQARVGMLSDRFDLALDRKQSCPANSEFDDYAKKFPEQGMPFAMPNLKDGEYRTLVQWLAQGSPVTGVPQPSAAARDQIGRWEAFLNADNDKQRLVSRYLYEHLFLGHMHFEGSGEREFYRLVRSTTPPGQPVDEIPTVRPYDDPGARFYYRLWHYPGDIVAKNHLVYELSDARLARLRQLFIEPVYRVGEFPSWDPQVAANPFQAFRDIPPRARYQFLLDDARYFIEGFIKGPVCRGMIALNVIEDQFWVVFTDPDRDSMLKHPELLASMADYLQIPSSQGDRVRILSIWKDYQKREQKYAQERFRTYQAMQKIDLDQAMDYLWDGGGNNPNAALTVFRHYDSASVDYGFIGDFPETAWVIDYPLLERIHYLLVAGFNVFGNLKHQLTTRLYMDFLRMEGEDMFLSFLPASHRQAIRDGWYVGMRKGMERDLGELDDWMRTDVVTGYRTTDPQRELYRRMLRYLAPVLARDDVINRGDGPARGAGEADKPRVDRAMRQIAQVRGEALRAFPDVALVRVRRHGAPEQDLVYSFIRNKAYKNVTSIFEDERDDATRDYRNDTLTVVDWIEGAYPNFFFDIAIEEIDTFTSRYAALRSRDDYERFVSRYGIRRTNSGFWETADWFQDQYRREKPVLSGLLDLNRYQNR